MCSYQNPKVGPSFMVTPIKQLKQSQISTFLLPPFHPVKALFAGKRIYLNIGHRHLKKNLTTRKCAIAFTCYVCKKGQFPNESRCTGESSRDISSLKENVCTINIIPTKKSELLVPFVSQAQDLNKPGIWNTHMCLPTVLYFQQSGTGGKLCGESWE